MWGGGEDTPPSEKAGKQDLDKVPSSTWRQGHGVGSPRRDKER